MSDPVVRLARMKVIKASADLEVQLSSRTGSAPTLEILLHLREAAAEALSALAFVDAGDANAVRELQARVKMYDEFFSEVRDLISRGVIYDKEITDEDREEMLDLLTQTPDGMQQAAALGLVDLQQQDA